MQARGTAARARSAEMPGRGVEGESSVELVCGVAVVGDVQDEACGDIMDALHPLLEFGRGSCIEGIAVVQFAAYEGLGDCSSGFSGHPFVDLSVHAEDVEAGGGDGVDLLGHE
ncbi:hypothetical protein NDU88_000890 [Pleurodeles waltl]|uniref:Uncharacterized protein n=1 Tax=Pleurodeles waltl TaxID=8319 RepID=A0AAV7LJU8_PLEWA|nr:hypothetical protein NDU88_000890 [Pleurodeles waltl]